MTPSHLSRVIAGAAVLALVFSFLAPFPAQAEESPPPAEPTAEATLAPDPAAPAVEPTLEGEATLVPTEASPAEGEVPPTEEPAPVEEPAAAPDLAEVIEAAPEGTTVAVVGEQGALLPLASEAAAEVVAGADPIWCPASVKAPTPLANGCSENFPTMAELITWLSNDANEPAMDGVIWLEAGLITGGPGFTFNGNTTFATMADYRLTLRGGWSNPATGGDNKVHTDTPSETHAMLTITNWRNDVTLSDLWITSAPAGDDLYVKTTGTITLTRVHSKDNSGRGAYLYNAGATTPKAVTISDSQFNENAGLGGLHVQSKGPITLTNVIAGDYDPITNTSYGNTGYGAGLYNADPGAVGGVTLLGVNTFSQNGGDGLSIESRGAITVSNLTASDNGGGAGTGATFSNSTSPTAAGVTLTGTNIFCNNATSGLVVTSLGPIKANGLIAHSNNSYGASLYNRDASPAQAVTLTGSNSFKSNAVYGLYVRSAGAITLNNLTASGNGNNGVRVLNNYGSSNSPVTLTGSSSFDDNTTDGLAVYSFGAIKGANLSASGNGLAGPSGYGLLLDNHLSPTAQAVTLTGKATASGNRDGGAYIWSAGAVSAQNVTAGDNLGIGLWIHNDVNPASPQKVSLSGTNTFLGNAGHGLSLYTYGAVTLAAVTASGNGASSAAPGAYITNLGGATAQKVTLTGANVFRDNDGGGLIVDAGGAIAVSSLTTTGNDSTGVSLDNAAATSPQPITLTGQNLFQSNDGDGLYVRSDGAISLASLTAIGNTGGGANAANNVDPAAPQKVTISGTNLFNDNGSGGLAVYSYGAITLSSATANGNGAIAGGSGAYLDNSGSNAPQAITLSGSFTFDDNDVFGLYLASKGAIKAASVTARNNPASGAWLSNSGPGAVGGITLSGTNRFNSNGTDGLQLISLGAITISNLTASGNGTGLMGMGAWIENNAALTPQKVTLSGTNVFNDNVQSGIAVSSLGAITASNLSASRNGAGGSAHGAVLDNGADPASTGGITLSGVSTFNGNGHDGLQVSSRGVISLNTSRLEASGNGWDGWGTGADLSNINAATLLGVTLKGVNTLNDNYSNGLYVWTRGAISASSLSASGNDSYGAWLANSTDPASTGGITLSGTNAFQDNTSGGLYAVSRGAITISNLTASDNSGQGASISNTGAATAQAVKLTGYGTFLDNTGAGLGVSSLGAVSAANLNASDNGGAGASLSNDINGAVGSLTLSGTNQFSDNASTGLYLSSRGAITISNLTASGNGKGGGGVGANVNNTNALTPQAVKLTGYASFIDNANAGLQLYSNGAITAANLTARGNVSDNGVYLNNTTGTAGVTLTGTNIFTGNGDNGLYLNSNGAVSLTRVTADGNGLNGVYVGWASSLTLTCGYLASNGGSGLYVNSPTDPLLIGVFASGNPSGDLLWNGNPTTSDVRACPLP